MIARRQSPVKQNPQSFLHCRKIAENRCKTQKSCNFNLQTGCGLGSKTIWNGFRCALAIFSGKKIYNFAFVAACGPLQTPFHGWGRKGKQPLHTLASSPSQSLRARFPFLSLRDIFPRPGEVFPLGGSFSSGRAIKPPPFGGGGIAQQ